MTFSSKMVNDFGNTFINNFYGFVLNGFIDLKVNLFRKKIDMHGIGYLDKK